MLVYTPLLLFSLLALELFSAAKKSTQEAHFAFLSSRMQSFKQQALSEMLEQLLEMKDVKRLQAVLNEARILKGTEDAFEDLESLERSMMEDVELRYNTILHYLTADLKEFFEAYKIVWDLQNVKLLLQHIINPSDSEASPALFGPFGHIDRASVRELAKHRTPEKLLERAKELLPVDVASRMTFEKNVRLRDFGFALDLAAFEYLKKRNIEIGTKNVSLAWSFLEGLYEVENLAVIARLKHHQAPAEQIIPFLFPSRSKLDDIDLKRLLETENHSAFLHALKNTSYGEYVRSENANLSDLENALKRSSKKLASEKTGDINAAMIVQFPFNVEIQSEVIRKMAFRTLIGGYEKR